VTKFGGLAKMHQRNKEKSKLLYDVIDSSNASTGGHAQRLAVPS